MQQFKCKCFGKNAICNDEHQISITIWRDKNNPEEEGEEYSKTIDKCPICGIELMMIK